MWPDPLIVTLTLDPAAQARFDALRSAHFPPERLHVGAHVTLFHALPGIEIAMISETLTAEAQRLTPFTLTVASVRSLGRGVALDLSATVLTDLRGRLRRQWDARLTPQDRQGWRPHLTIQNKVEPSIARALHGRLSAAFVPYTVTATGLSLWHYRGGPWDVACEFPFQRQS